MKSAFNKPSPFLAILEVQVHQNPRKKGTQVTPFWSFELL